MACCRCCSDEVVLSAEYGGFEELHGLELSMLRGSRLHSVRQQVNFETFASW